MTKPILLVVDDDPLIVNVVGNVGQIAGFDINTAFSANEFQEAWENATPTIIVMDLVMPDMDGIALLMWLAEQNCSVPIVLMSGYDGKYLKMAENLGTAKGIKIIGTLTKPFKADELEGMLKEALPSAG